MSTIEKQQKGENTTGSHITNQNMIEDLKMMQSHELEEILN